MVKEQPSSVVADRFEGMLLLGAFGDALGAPRELSALEGEIAANPDEPTLLPAAEVVRRRTGLTDLASFQGTTWGIWPDGAAVEDFFAAPGLPTDDTGVRSALVEEWLWETMSDGAEVTEAAFEAWVRRHAPPEGEPVDPSLPWLERRVLEQARDWRSMFHRAHHPSEFIGDETLFFHPGVPVIFGPFLYLPLAAAFFRLSPDEVFHRFFSFSLLDQEHGRVVTALLAALTAQAITDTPYRAGIGEWLFSAAGPLLETARRHIPRKGLGLATEAQHFAWLDEVEEALFDARQMGLEARRRRLGSRAFLERVQEEIYRPAVPGPQQGRPGLAPYEPLLMLRQMAVTAAYGGQDPIRLLRLLAAGPGDADTLPFLMGSLAGAWYGRRSLEALPGWQGNEVVAVERTLWRLFRLDLPLQARMYVQLLEEADG